MQESTNKCTHGLSEEWWRWFSLSIKHGYLAGIHFQVIKIRMCMKHAINFSLFNLIEKNKLNLHYISRLSMADLALQQEGNLKHRWGLRFEMVEKSWCCRAGRLTMRDGQSEHRRKLSWSNNNINNYCELNTNTNTTINTINTNINGNKKNKAKYKWEKF